MKINIIGTGVMGMQINALFNHLGFDTFIWDKNEVDTRLLDKEIKKLQKILGEPDVLGEYKVIYELENLENLVTIEAIVEDLSLKREIYRRIKSLNNNLYFSNSSSYSPKDIAEDVSSLHFFNPISIRLIEYYLASENLNDNEEWKKIKSALEKINYKLIRVHENRGFIGNYVLFGEISTYFKLIEKFDYDNESLKSIYSTLYDGRDLIKIIDIIGIDVVYKILVNLKEEDESIYLPQIFKLAIEKNILGKKNKTSILMMLNGNS